MRLLPGIGAMAGAKGNVWEDVFLLLENSKNIVFFFKCPVLSLGFFWMVFDDHLSQHFAQWKS